MIRFDIITIFPNIFDSYIKESLIARAQAKRFIKIRVHNLRKWTNDRHKTVDDRPFGGGLGMVLKIEPLFKAIKALKKKSAQGRSALGGNAKVILFTPRGKKFDQKTAYRLAQAEHLIFICGRYEGVDERVAQHLVDEEISIGDYDLMGGELPAMVVIETVSRLIPGVLGKPQLLKERITKNKGFIEYEQYTRPEVFSAKGGSASGGKKWHVP
ncbi:MAG: tRNA (guanosine(37)-N1)-methyltransferase TrmD, partial [Patescibacteria group bacterium]